MEEIRTKSYERNIVGCVVGEIEGALKMGKRVQQRKYGWAGALFGFSLGGGMVGIAHTVWVFGGRGWGQTSPTTGRTRPAWEALVYTRGGRGASFTQRSNDTAPTSV